MTTLTNETIVPAAYSIDGRHLDAVYVTGMAGKPDGLYWPARIASRVVERDTTSINRHARKGAIRNFVWNGIRYLCADDIKPDGYLYVEEAAAAKGYTVEWMHKLAEAGTFDKVYRLGRLLLSAHDASNYGELPEGFITHKEAELRYASRPTLIKWVSSGRVETVDLPLGYGMRESDLIKAKSPPRGYISWAEARKKFSYSERYLRQIAATLPVRKKKVCKQVFLRRADLEKCIKAVNSGVPVKRTVAAKPYTAESQIAEPAMNATPDPRYALHDERGQPTAFALDLFDRHATVVENGNALVRAMLNELKEKGNGHGTAEKDLRAMVKEFSKVG